MGLDLGDIVRGVKKIGAPILGAALDATGGGAILDVVQGVLGNTDNEAELYKRLEDPEVIKDLKEIESKNKVELARLAFKKEELNFEDAKSRRDLIRSESASEDPWVRRARPSFLWIMYAVIGFNWIILPAVGIFNATAAPIQLPTELYWLFGSAFLGYTTFRSVDKKGGISNLMEMMGGLKK